jgi:hypothetical protein
MRCNRVPIHTGQAEVDQHGLGAESLGACKRARSVGGDTNLVSEHPKKSRDANEGVDVIVDEHDADWPMRIHDALPR